MHHVKFALFGLTHFLGEDVLIILDAFVPHRLEDGGKRSHADSCPHQHDYLITKHVLAGGTKWAVYGDPERESEWWTGVTNDSGL